MATFTDENSALGDLDNRVRSPCCWPIIFGALISAGTYLVARDTMAYGLLIPAGLFFGIIMTTLCFFSEKEEQMLIEGDDPCMSSRTNERVKPDVFLWLSMQGKYAISAFVVFGALSWFGDPVFAAYLDGKELLFNL
jgi:hypothetical protein